MLSMIATLPLECVNIQTKHCIRSSADEVDQLMKSLAQRANASLKLKKLCIGSKTHKTSLW